MIVLLLCSLSRLGVTSKPPPLVVMHRERWGSLRSPPTYNPTTIFPDRSTVATAFGGNINVVESSSIIAGPRTATPMASR